MNHRIVENHKNIEKRILGFGKSIIKLTVDFRKQAIFEIYYIICAIASIAIGIVISILNLLVVI